VFSFLSGIPSLHSMLQNFIFLFPTQFLLLNLNASLYLSRGLDAGSVRSGIDSSTGPFKLVKLLPRTIK
jgi:hypothetical protein